ncbi:hypothetical protein V1264_004576 [Littorina saxatilis]|uniref:Uncharacterized protein n=1 Tax=Littorina saxatilis TaxID=31220 RepID=A0AAN9B201_9CAEN
MCQTLLKQPWFVHMPVFTKDQFCREKLKDEEKMPPCCKTKNEYVSQTRVDVVGGGDNGGVVVVLLWLSVFQVSQCCGVGLG